MRVCGPSIILNLYAVAQDIVSTSMFPEVMGDLEPPIRAGLYRIVQTNFAESHVHSLG